MTKTLVEQYVEDAVHMRLFQQERAVYEITELIESVMKEENVNRTKLAELLGKSKGWVTQLLDGEANKTIRTVADVLAVMGREFSACAPKICISNEFTFRIVLDENATWDSDYRPSHFQLKVS